MRSTEEERRERNWRLRNEYARRLGEIRRSLSAAQIPLLYALYPSHHSLSGSGAREQIRWVEQMARSLGIETVSFLDRLKASAEPMDVLYLLPDDGHPSPLGYELAGAELLRRFDWSAYSHETCVP